MWPERERMFRTRYFGGVDRPNVAKNVWWYAECPKHGKQPHLDANGGRCCLCAIEQEKEGKKP